MNLQLRPWLGGALQIVLLTALLAPPLVAPEVAAQTRSSKRWPTTAFKVVHHEPVVRPSQGGTAVDAGLEWMRETLRRAVLGEELERQKTAADAPWERLVESYLQDIAQRYQEAGFEPPDLQMVKHEGQNKYVIYLYNYRDSIWAASREAESGGTAHNLFDDGQDWIGIDRADYTYDPNQANDVKLYHALAHEVFHALQGVYDRKYGSIAGGKVAPGRDVVVEGIANGAAMYLLSKKFPHHLEAKEAKRFYLGAFPYYTGFIDAKKGDVEENPYFTGSLWFHLAERFGSLSVIEYILRRRLPGLTIEDRIRWLEGALKDHPGVKEGLYTIYPHFVTELASYGAGRYERVTPDRWLGWTLWGCKEVNFSPSTERDAKVGLDIFSLESRCISTAWSGFPADGQLQVEAIGSDRDVVDQLHLGIASGEGTCWKFLSGLDPAKRRKQTCLLEKLKVQTGPHEGMWVKTWELAPGGYGASGRAVFVLVNIAVKPWETKQADGTTVRFGFARTEAQAKKLAPPEAEHLRIPPYPPLRELTYGIRDKKPMPGSLPVPEIAIPVLEAGGKDPQLLESFLKGNLNRKKSDRVYKVMPDFTRPIVPGYTGPFYGLATLNDPSLSPGVGAGVGSLITSALCSPTSAQQPIGQVLHAGEDQLKVHVKTDLCEFKVSVAPPFGQAPKKVDHLDAVLVLPFGWRYFRESAPVDVVTSGVEIFIDRYHERMRELWGPRWLVDVVPTGAGPGSAPAAGTGPRPGAGAGSGSVLGKRSGCDCSCEAFNKMKELGKRRDAESQRKLKEMSVCAMQCVSQWMTCAQK